MFVHCQFTTHLRELSFVFFFRLAFSQKQQQQQQQPQPQPQQQPQQQQQQTKVVVKPSQTYYKMMQHQPAIRPPSFHPHLKQNTPAMAKQYHQRGASYESRTRLLNRLGIFDAPQKKTLGKPLTSSLLEKPSLVGPAKNQLGKANPSVLGAIEPIQAKLNDCSSPPVGTNWSAILTSSAVSSPSSALSTMRKDSVGVKFNETVSIIEIPSRYQYSDRIKKVIWSDRYELSENAERNIFEFAHEGYDWRNVVMDDEMYIDSVSGALIHPCHFMDSIANNNGDENEDSKSNENELGFMMLGRSNSIAQI
jgi:hypothetical protein